MPASHKPQSETMLLMALMTVRDDIANLEKEASTLIRVLADAHGVAASYPPTE
jgi:hypothetical protein